MIYWTVPQVDSRSVLLNFAFVLQSQFLIDVFIYLKIKYFQINHDFEASLGHSVTDISLM